MRFFLMGFLIIMTFAACQKQPSVTPATAGPVETPALQFEDIRVGGGVEVQKGMTVSIHYTARVKDGPEFDDSRKRGRPFQFKVGAGTVIRGWDEGMVSMRVGGKRILTVPPEYGHGSDGLGVIPPNATLEFEIDLLEAK